MTLIFPEVVVFEYENFSGESWHINTGQFYVGDHWNDRISSVIVISGTWAFFEDRDYPPGHNRTVGPGWYSSVTREPFYPNTNDTISSIRLISWNPQGDNPIFI